MKKLYVQDEDTAVGNPLSSLIAHCFMNYFAIKAKQIIQYFPPIRYVYDIFAVFHQKESLEDFCDNINRFYPTVNVTTEVKKDNNHNFLEVKCVYRKNRQGYTG